MCVMTRCAGLSQCTGRSRLSQCTGRSSDVSQNVRYCRSAPVVHYMSQDRYHVMIFQRDKERVSLVRDYCDVLRFYS